MAIVIGIIFDFMWWIIGIGVAICMLVILWGIIKYATAQGDPNRAAGGRNTMAGGGFGVVALPLTIVAMRIFFADVVAPNTGIDPNLLEENCDDFLRAQLRSRGQVLNDAQAYALIKAIQVQKSGCGADGWMGAADPFEKTVATCVATGESSNGLSRVRELVKDDDQRGFGRIGGAIMLAFDVDNAKHLPNDEACWSYDPQVGRWLFGTVS